MEMAHYYDNSLIFKVTKEGGPLWGPHGIAPAPPPLAAIWTVLIVFYANHFHWSIGDLWKCCSYNVTSSGLAHERNISGQDEKIGRQYTARQYNYWFYSNEICSSLFWIWCWLPFKVWFLLFLSPFVAIVWVQQSRTCTLSTGNS